jgi:mannose-6-phosphate isomerase-like protein (cupin superfamily)
MKRYIGIGLFCAGYLAGMATMQHTTVNAQAPGQPYPGASLQAYPGGPPAPRAEPGKWMYWSGDDLKKRFLVPGDVSTTLAWTPQYRLNVNRRAYLDPEKMTRTSKMMSHWDDAEMHEDMTQIYFMLGGIGAIALGGKPEKEALSSTQGNHGGGPLLGATIQRVKPGDLILIPPYTWHQNQPDAGQQLTYAMCHVETRNSIP